MDFIPSDANLEDDGKGIEESMESGEAGAPVSPWRLRGDGMITFSIFYLFCSVFFMLFLLRILGADGFHMFFMYVTCITSNEIL